MLNDLEKALFALTHYEETLWRVYVVTNDVVEKNCAIVPQYFPGHVPNPQFYVCNWVKLNLARAFNFLIHAADIAEQTIRFELEDVHGLDEGNAIDNYRYSKATCNGLKELDEWDFDALETINTNIFKQHSEMREHLQDHHQIMTTDIVEFLEESTSILGNEFNKQNQCLDSILCEIYKQAGAESCEGSVESLLDLVVSWPEKPH